MNQTEWRKAVLERDTHECQFSKLFGVAHLTGVPCSSILQVHHNTYVNYGCENLEDGIAVCTRCHDLITDMIRRLRYNKRSPPMPSLAKKEKPILFEERSTNDAKLEIQDGGSITLDTSQRPTSRPPKQLHPCDKGDFVKTEKG